MPGPDQSTSPQPARPGAPPPGPGGPGEPPPELQPGESSVSDGYLHIGPDWRITFADLGSQLNPRRERPEYQGRLLWDLFPDIRGTRFEQEYLVAMRERRARTFVAYYPPIQAWMENRLFPAGDGIALFYRDLSLHHRLQGQLERRRLQQAAVARLGQTALEEIAADDLVDLAVREVAALLEVPFAKFVAPRAGGGDLVLRAGVGWREGLVGHALVPSGPHSQAGYALEAHGPVVVDDLAAETRFRPAPLFVEHGVVSGISVLVGPRDEPIGVLGAHSPERRHFTQDDLNFLQAVANLLAAALTRGRIEGELRRHRDDLEALVRERTRLLEASVEELEAFSYSVSHDLRAPLRAIDGFSRLLEAQYGPQLPAEAKLMLGRVRDGAQRMGHLIESLLSLARLGRAGMVRREVDLSALATALAAELQARQPGRAVRWSIQPGLWAHGDEGMLRVALGNLLDNAWKFTQGTPQPAIAFGRGDDGAFFVRDNGAGFDLAHAGRLFEPFQRLHALSEFEGTGIGLATVQRVVRRHGGRVWAEAAPGRGATFRFTLDVGAGGPPPPAAAHPRPKPAPRGRAAAT